MQELLLVNPRKRRRGGRGRARDARGRFLKRSGGTRRRRASVAHRTRRRSIHLRKRGSVRIYANPRRRSYRALRRRRRNPIGGRGIVNQLTGSIMPAVVGAGGAIVNDALMRFIPLPAMLRGRWTSILTRAVLAIGTGMLIGRMVNQRVGAQMASGALTVLAYNQIAPFVPFAGGSRPMGDMGEGEELGYYGAGMPLQALPNSLSQMPDSLSEYLSGSELNEYLS
jgi:hypothetical protein